MKRYLKFGIILIVIVLGVLIGVAIYYFNHEDEKYHINQENNIVINDIFKIFIVSIFYWFFILATDS